MGENNYTPESDPQEPHLPDPVRPESLHKPSPGLIMLTLAIVAGVMIAFWWTGRAEAPRTGQIVPLPTRTESRTTRPLRPSVLLTRAAADAAIIPTATPTAAAISSLVALPTVTPVLSAAAVATVATRTVELRGEATLRLTMGNDSFQSRGDPVTLSIKPRAIVLGGDTLMQSDRFCVQVGPSGLVFDLTWALLPVSEDLRVVGTIALHDGFCSSLGSLGELRASAPLEVTIPADAAAQLVQNLQAKSNLLGVNDVLDTATGVYLELTIRNPQP